MNATHRIFAVAAFAALGTSFAHADEADGSQYGIQVQSSRSAADVRAEARNPIRITNGGTGVMDLTESRSSAQAVRQQAAQEARAGNTSRGEIGLM
jgi:hypothetical protein